MIRVLIVHNIMAPYRYPLFQAIDAQRDIELTVWFMAPSARNRRWLDQPRDAGFKYEVLPHFDLSYFSNDLFTYIVNYSFPWRYARAQFDVLISAGWLDFAAQTGLVLSKLLRRKFILWSESTAYEPSWRRSVSAPLVKAIVGGADACIAVGTRSREYLHHLGARDSDTFTAFSTVDVELFQRASQSARVHRASNRDELGIRRSHVLLYCGQFIERKGLHVLLDAFASVKRRFDDVALVLVGYGPARDLLKAQIARLNLVDVHFIDHVETSEMPRLYALADVFVLPSLEETWGLVVNEAMACGLPVIVTDRVGSSVDLVVDGDNGFVVPARDAAAIADRSVRLLEDSILRAHFSECSADRILQFTPERAATAFAAAVRHAMQT
jgi:glycosyltransferase involved in cell wall biosynthesis